ncbi:MAG: histidine phosphatase family protein [Candidatus Thorarchaeota archaeon]
MVSEHEWNTIDWLEEARSLLDWLDTVDSGPVLLMIRHSERLEDIDVPTTIRAELTKFGHELAVEFGRRIPKSWRTTIYHSPHIRTTQTAERISKGLQEEGGHLLDIERLNVLLGGRGDIEEIITLAYEFSFDEFYRRWTRDEIPIETIEPIDGYLARLTQQVIGRFSEAGTNDLHIHVTHDIVIAASMRIYLDTSVDEGLLVPFLGGYGIAGTSDNFVGFKGGKLVEASRNLCRNIKKPAKV